MKLSILIPVYNEAGTIETLLNKVLAAPLPGNMTRQLVIVNDASTDGSEKVLQQYIAVHTEVEILFHSFPVNEGKGAALHQAIQMATGDVLVVQDADLEYNPNEYSVLLQPILDGNADVVYGSRFMGGRPHRVLYFWHSVGNKFLTLMSNMFTNLNLTDMETCYKMFRAEVIKSLKLKEKRFGFEPEVTAKMSRYPNVRVYEVGVSYNGRTYQEGKKIGWRDGVRALYVILRYNLFV